MKLIAKLTDKTVLGTEGISCSAPRYTSRAIIKDSEGKFAVMYMKKYGIYLLPGGGIDPGEDEITALRREILEETGCSCDYIREIGIVEENRFHRDYTQISYYYFVKTNGKISEISLTESEIETETEVQWYSFEKIKELIKNYPAETNQQKFLKARDLSVIEEFEKNLFSMNMILHCAKLSTWEEHKNKDFWGKCNLDSEGFIHCSQPEYFWRVAPNFNKMKDELVILCIDETKLSAKVKYEDGDGCGRSYPHIYGLINNSAIIAVLPFLRGKDGKWIKNPELNIFEDK